MFLLSLFALWRIADIAITLIAPRFVPYLGFFPYKEVLVQYHLPAFLANLASFDGVHYTQIADNGYAQNEQAFFPLYPLLIKGLSFLTGNRLAAGLLISNIAFLAGLYLFPKFALQWVGKSGKLSPVVFLLIFPTSFYFGVVYTEGLFFLLFISSLYFLKKKNYWAAGILAALSSATRLIGAFLIIPFAIDLLWEKRIELKRLITRTVRFLPVLVSPFVGLLAYMGYLWIATGDPLYFFHAQPSFGANRSTHLITLPQVYFRYLKILLTANHNFQYFTSLLEVSVFTFCAVILLLDLVKHLRNKDRLALNLFSFANLILPTLTGTFSSIPRYALFSISLYFFMAEIRDIRLRGALIIILSLLHIVLLSFFIQGYFIS